MKTKELTDNKLFWKLVKPLPLDKSRIDRIESQRLRDSINISVKGEILKTGRKKPMEL